MCLFIRQKKEISSCYGMNFKACFLSVYGVWISDKGWMISRHVFYLFTGYEFLTKGGWISWYVFICLWGMGRSPDTNHMHAACSMQVTPWPVKHCLDFIYIHFLCLHILHRSSWWTHTCLCNHDHIEAAKIYIYNTGCCVLMLTLAIEHDSTSNVFNISYIS